MSHAEIKTGRNDASLYNRSYGEKSYDHEVMSYTHSSSPSEKEIFDNDTWYGTNNSNWSTPLPIDMQFNDGHRLQIAVYSVLMIISAIGNITVLALLIKRRLKSHSRIDMMLTHLAIADLLVLCCIAATESFEKQRENNDCDCMGNGRFMQCTSAIHFSRRSTSKSHVV